MTADKIKSRIEECATLFGFKYNGNVGNVDPYFKPTTKSYEYVLFFNGEEQTVFDIETVMSTPFINGHSLNEIAERLEITDW